MSVAEPSFLSIMFPYSPYYVGPGHFYRFEGRRDAFLGLRRSSLTNGLPRSDEAVNEGRKEELSRPG